MNHHPKIAHQALRSWWNAPSRLSAQDLVLPIFISEEKNCRENIESMPFVLRLGLAHLEEYLKPLVELGLRAVLLFGVMETPNAKDSVGSRADSAEGPVLGAIGLLRERFPGLLVMCDVCLCDYTDHGHCGILSDGGHIDKKKTLDRLADIAVSYATAGAHVVAPSDMMDNRISTIKAKLLEAGLDTVAIMSYSAKYSSALYGPFRDACKSSPSFGDRKCYQLPVGSTELGVLTTQRDIDEGADFIMVKPGLFYLDVVKEVKSRFKDYPLAAYQVSGEYVMIHDYAIKSSNYKNVVTESLVSLKRAGADILISYFTPQVLEWLKSSNGVLM